MRHSESNIESLLLLCCLVGAVSFYCLSIAASKLLSISTCAAADDSLSVEKTKISERIVRLKSGVDSLQNLKERLQKEIQQCTKRSANQSNQPEETERLEKTRKKLELELAKLEKERERVKRLLSEEHARAPERTKESAIAEMDALKKKKEKLDKQTKARTEELARYGNSRIADETAENLQEKYQGLIQKTAELDNIIKELRLRILTAGAEYYSNPIYFDCKKNTIRIYPENLVLTLSEAEKTAIEPLVAGHDIIILYVRPDGYETFNAMEAKIVDVKLAVCYEPLDATQNMESLLGN